MKLSPQSSRYRSSRQYPRRHGLVTIEVGMFIAVVFPIFVAGVILTKKMLTHFDHMNAVYAAWPFL